ncbi:hypothetical protein B0T11DRAFT_352439 [Plectosphaerella cucumerina]|jgi:NAD(P)-dependent dehydrogenase (short-subunit alcohol dehydrogenase family)|uniref:Uncharacterized protein n=1 Tax=Plectosphaerella cucumerina TaxID=40658 RepID=A0A8K0TH23_9PEZI|nr:hypothetical protein B0T11DRAFT_352439 [Plectosphaerella cucumerina]
MAFAGKVFVVTGGSSGVGRATVRKLLQQSAAVHALDINDIPLHNDLPGRLSTHKVDVTSRGDIKATFDKIIQLEERNDSRQWLHGLVNCAGMYRDTPVSANAKGDSIFELLWKVNVMGTWHVASEFHERLRAVREANPGQFTDATASIVNVGSMASVRGIPRSSAYVASKHAVLGLSRVLAQELGPSGFRVNTVAPGAVNTPMLNVAVQERGGTYTAGPYDGAFKRMSEPEEIADTILYLLGDGSSSVTGHLLEVNGGWP